MTEKKKEVPNEVESYENEIFAQWWAERFVYVANSEKKILYEEANVCMLFCFHISFNWICINLYILNVTMSVLPVIVNGVGNCLN